MSGNQCAYPGCNQEVVAGGGTLTGDVCHIKADKPKGPRYDQTQTKVQRQDFANLIVLCPTHHRLVDGDQATYTVERLASMKKRHEGYSSTRPRFVISDDLAQHIKVAMIAGTRIGSAAGAAIIVSEAIREATPTFSWLLQLFTAGSSRRRDREEARIKRRLVDTLRYGPKATVEFGSLDQTHISLGYSLADIFHVAGWTARKMDNSHLLQIAKANRLDASRCLVLAVSVRDSNQMPNALRALNDLYRECHLVSLSREHGWKTKDGAGLGVATFILRG